MAALQRYNHMLNHSRIDLLAKVRIVIYLQSTILQSIGGRTVSINKSKRSANNMLVHDFSTKTESNLLSCNLRFFKSLVFATLLLVCNQAMPDVIDDIKADMLLNEAKLLKAPASAGWSKKANIVMGAAPRGDATPSWWRPSDTEYKSKAIWDAVIPWFHIYPGTKHTAKNVRIKISALKLYILEKSTNQWRRINADSMPTWDHHTHHISPSTASEEVDIRIEPDGIPSYKLNSGLNPIHGGAPKYVISGYDVKAVFAQVTTQLILDDPTDTDDRVDAQILVSVGADYYPTTAHTVRDFAPMTYLPSVGASRYGLVRNTPRTHYFATIDPPGPVKTGSGYQYKPAYVIPIAEFESNPPPGLVSSTVTLSMCN
ncbi:hypothetical protein [Nitrosomonas sp.]|uniref:hypothetical protein n=1 Tax=Nitrosomonas sp. TaxID=42353 RepID=UPI0025D58649|nr:hypothetical protein [Nitrosomonas sp.]